MNVSESQKLEQQNNDQPKDFERLDKRARQNQVIKKKIDYQITRAVSSAVMIVENCMHDGNLTTTDNVVIPRVEMAVKSITGSTGHRMNNDVQNPDRRDLLGNIRNTPFMSASGRLN